MARWLIAGAVLWSVACSRGPSAPADAGTAGAASKPKEPTQLSLQLFGDPAEVDSYRRLVAGFEAKNPDVKVDLIPVGKQKEFMAKLTTAFSGGTPPDVFLINYRRFGQLAQREVLEPLGEQLGKGIAVEESALYPGPVEAFRFDGKLQCLPQNVSSLVVYFNKALFAAHKVPLPKEGWTWAEFLAAAKAITDRSSKDPSEHVHGVGLEPVLPRLAPFVWQAGGEVVDDPAKPTRLTLDSPASVAALKFVLELRRKHNVTPTLEEVTAQDLESRFIRGKLGMLLQSRRFTTTAREAKELDWDVAPLPAGKVSAASVLHSDAYCVAKASPNKEAAYKFLSYALGTDGATLIARTGRTVPSLKAVAESEAFLSPSEKPASSKVFLDAIPGIRRLPNTASWHEIESRADPIIEEWFYGPDRTPDGLAGPPKGAFGGSAKNAVRMGDELTILNKELNEATRALWTPPAP